MTIRFAAASNSRYFPATRGIRLRHDVTFANDNGSGKGDALLTMALRHFAAHGLRAGTAARDEAKSAFFTGDREGYDRWRTICRMLDTRAAHQLAAETRTPYLNSDKLTDS